MEVFAWLVLRIAFAGLFLCALKSLSKDRAGAENLVRLLLPTAQPILISFWTVMMFLCMFFGSLSILLGIYAQLAGLSLLVYCLIGVVVHYRLAGQAKKIRLSVPSSSDDKRQLEQAIQLAVVGNATSAQKNFVLAAVACFFMLMGSGPYSLTAPVF